MMLGLSDSGQFIIFKGLINQVNTILDGVCVCVIATQATFCGNLFSKIDDGFQHLVILSDFNAVLNAELDRSKLTKFNLSQYQKC